MHRPPHPSRRCPPISRISAAARRRRRPPPQREGGEKREREICRSTTPASPPPTHTRPRPAAAGSSPARGHGAHYIILHCVALRYCIALLHCFIAALQRPARRRRGTTERARPPPGEGVPRAACWRQGTREASVSSPAFITHEASPPPARGGGPSRGMLETGSPRGVGIFSSLYHPRGEPAPRPGRGVPRVACKELEKPPYLLSPARRARPPPGSGEGVPRARDRAPLRACKGKGEPRHRGPLRACEGKGEPRHRGPLRACEGKGEPRHRGPPRACKGEPRPALRRPARNKRGRGRVRLILTGSERPGPAS